MLGKGAFPILRAEYLLEHPYFTRCQVPQHTHTPNTTHRHTVHIRLVLTVSLLPRTSHQRLSHSALSVSASSSATGGRRCALNAEGGGPHPLLVLQPGHPDETGEQAMLLCTFLASRFLKLEEVGIWLVSGRLVQSS